MSQEQEDTQPQGHVGRHQYEVVVGGHTFHLAVSREDYNRFMRESQKDVQRAANNFLMRTCAEADKEPLRAACEANWSLALQVVAPITDELGPETEVVVKKR